LSATEAVTSMATCECELQVAVHARTGVAEAQRLGLDAVHQDDAYTREGVVVELAVHGLDELLPGEPLLVDGYPFVLE
jgi:hypothetical protein